MTWRLAHLPIGRVTLGDDFRPLAPARPGRQLTCQVPGGWVTSRALPTSCPLPRRTSLRPIHCSQKNCTVLWWEADTFLSSSGGSAETEKDTAEWAESRPAAVNRSSGCVAPELGG